MNTGEFKTRYPRKDNEQPAVNGTTEQTPETDLDVAEYLKLVNDKITDLYDLISCEEDMMDASVDMQKIIVETNSQVSLEEVVNFAIRFGRLKGLKEAHEIVKYNPDAFSSQ